MLCCVGPLVPILLGTGGGTVLLGLDRYRPVFLLLGFLVLVGTSWYAVRKRNQCCSTRSRVANMKLVGLIFGIGLGTYLVMAYIVVPRLATIASEKVRTAETVTIAAHTVSLDLRVDGMTCAGCAVGVEQALLGVPGVTSAQVDWQTGFGTVEYDPETVAPDQILQAPVADHYALYPR